MADDTQGYVARAEADSEYDATAREGMAALRRALMLADREWVLAVDEGREASAKVWLMRRAEMRAAIAATWTMPPGDSAEEVS